jgi:hypothetical protein
MVARPTRPQIWRTTGYRCGTGPFPQCWRSWPKPPSRLVLCYATAKLLRDEAESMVPNIDPTQVRKLAGWGLTQNDRASFVGWSPQPSAVGPGPHQPGFFIDLCI